LRKLRGYITLSARVPGRPVHTLLTFHKIIAGCAAGGREAWRAFLEEYTPAFLGLLGVYLGPESGPLAWDAWKASLVDLTSKRFERLRSLDQQSEKEFLLGLRRLVLSRAACRADPKTQPMPVLSSPQDSAVERVQGLLAGLPLIHQEVVFLKLTGYSENITERLLHITPAVAQQGLERLRDIARTEPAEWFRVLEHAWSVGTDNCPAPRRLIRIQEGQISWYDRDPVEQHLAACLHCLELWTALGEVRYWRRESRPLAPARIDELLALLPIEAAPATRRPLLARVLRSDRA
jgi:hypothetical protein